MALTLTRKGAFKILSAYFDGATDPTSLSVFLYTAGTPSVTTATVTGFTEAAGYTRPTFSVLGGDVVLGDPLDLTGTILVNEGTTGLTNMYTSQVKVTFSQATSNIVGYLLLDGTDVIAWDTLTTFASTGLNDTLVFEINPFNFNATTPGAGQCALTKKGQAKLFSAYFDKGANPATVNIMLYTGGSPTVGTTTTSGFTETLTYYTTTRPSYAVTLGDALGGDTNTADTAGLLAITEGNTGTPTSAAGSKLTITFTAAHAVPTVGYLLLDGTDVIGWGLLSASVQSTGNGDKLEMALATLQLY